MYFLLVWIPARGLESLEGHPALRSCGLTRPVGPLPGQQVAYELSQDVPQQPSRTPVHLTCSGRGRALREMPAFLGFGASFTQLSGSCFIRQVFAGLLGGSCSVRSVRTAGARPDLDAQPLLAPVPAANPQNLEAAASCRRSALTQSFPSAEGCEENRLHSLFLVL